MQNCLKSGLKRKIYFSKHQTKVSTERINQYLDFWIDPIFSGVNKHFFFTILK